MCYELTDHEWSAIKPMLPNEVRGVRRVDDRRVLNGIFWVLRSGAPWRDLPQEFGPYTCKERKKSTGSLFTRATSAPLHPVKAQISVAHNWIDRNYQLGRGAANCLDFYNDPSDEIFSTVMNTVDLVL
jgi:Putative transposase of IS4/5 family (DUF4096)